MKSFVTAQNISHDRPQEFRRPRATLMVSFADSEPHYIARRSPLVCANGCVSTSQPLASEIGLRILKAGGNAADACIAAVAALNCTEPCMCGIGGDAFCLYYDAATKKVHGLNGSGAAPEIMRRTLPPVTLAPTVMARKEPHAVFLPPSLETDAISDESACSSSERRQPGQPEILQSGDVPRSVHVGGHPRHDHRDGRPELPRQRVAPPPPLQFDAQEPQLQL